MSFKLTDEEKNLFIQNGFDMDRVGNWIDMQYFDGKSEAEVDFELREMIDSLKGVTPTSASDAENVSKWQQKGTIGAYEFAKMNTFVDKDGVTKWQPQNTDINESVQPVGNNKYADTPFEKFGNAWKNAGEKANLDTMFKPVKELADKANRFAANAAKNWTYRQILAGQHDVTGRDGKIGFWEAMGKNYSTATVLPFVGGYLEGAQKEWITEIAEKIDNDTPLTWQEELVYETLVNKVKEERTRGYSIMGGIGDSLLPSLIRFSAEMALSGGVLNNVGLMNKAAKANGIRGKFVEGLKDMGKLGAAGVVLNPSEIYSAYQARDFENKMRLTPEGEMLFAQSQEAPATTLIKSLADVALSFACEGSGKSISALGQGVGKVGGHVVAKLTDPVNQYLAKNKNLRNVIETVYPKIIDMAQKAKKIGDGVNAKTAFLADKVRFDGFLEEIGEEKLEDFLSTALGLQKENPTFDDLLQSLGGSPDEWAILCGTVALQGGALSLTSRVLQKHLGNVGMTDPEIEEVVNTLSETEKKSLVKNMLDKGIIDANTAEKIQSSEFWEDAKQKLYEEFSAQGSDEQKAKLAAELFSFMGAFKAEYGGVSDEEAFAELGTVKTEDYRNKEISDAVAERARTKREFAENFKNSNYLADFLDAENISQSEYENLSDEEKRDFALTKAMEIYDAEHQSLANERLPQDSEPTVLTGRVEYNEEEENQAPQKPLTDAQIDNLARELAEFDESGETIGAFLSVLENDTNTDNIEILKNAIQSIPASADLINFINSKTQNKVYNQSEMYKSPLDNFQDVYQTQNIQDNFGQPAEELQEMFSEDIKNILAENEINSDEFEIEDVRLYGSYTTGKNKDTSDLDVIVQYKGSMKEDTAFNLLNDAKLTITDVNGIERKIDINPINSRLSGTIDEHIERMHEIDGAYFQSAVTAGAETSAEISDAQKEWQEKGTGSKYFKKWFGDSKVVDENGKPLVVYHGTDADFEEFNPETFTSANGRSVLGNGFYFTQYRNKANEYGTNVLPVYLSIKNPYVVYNSTTGEESKPMQFLERIAEIMYGENYKDYLLENDGYYATGYLEGKLNTNSGFIDLMQGLQYKGKLDTREFLQSFGYDGIQDGDVFVAFTPEQIKSVNNRGTFDEFNPNIYYQTAYHGTPHRFEEFSTENIGSGEGAQAHGWGLYFAEDKNISEDYRKKLTGDNFDNEQYFYDNNLIEHRNKKAALASILENGKDKVIRVREKSLKNYKEYGTKTEYETKKAELEWIKTLDENKIQKKTDKGQLFKVEIPEDDEMLDEDKPLNEQPDKVKKAILEYYKSRPNDYIIPEDINSLSQQRGKQFYRDVAFQLERENSLAYRMANGLNTDIDENFNPEKEASLLLNSLGIKGIKYDGRTDGQCYVVFNPENIDITRTFYQEGVNEDKQINDEKNLLMTHNAKSDNIDAILESGNLIAPSFAITKKDYEVDALSKFGDVTFIRKPEKIKFGSDNIYNRDIYSPRMPRPEYQLKDGTVIDSYEKEAQERLEKEKPEKYKERFDKPTSERFKDAKKVMFLGYTPSGNRRYKPYTAENIIAQMKKEGLLSGENFDYGLSSLMSRFATKQKSMEELKESAKDGLYSSKQLNEDYENLKKEYEELGDKVAPLYWDKYSFYEFQSDVFFAIAKNKKKYLKDTYNIEVPTELEKEVKDFVKKAQTLPRSYFEAKPMREVSLDEFGYAIARIGTLTNSQREKLENVYHIDVIEYEDNIKEALEQVETEQPEIYFQTGINQGEITNIDGSIVEDVTNPLAYDYLNNQVTGEKINIELNTDIKVDKIESQEISSSLPFEISQKPSNNKKALIKSLNLGNNKALQVKNINTNEVVNIKDKTIEKSLSNVRISDEHYKDFCTILYNVKNLFETSQKILGHNDAKRNNGIKINRYANIAKVNNNEYLLEFVSKDNGEVLLYSVDLLDKRKQYRENASSKNSMQHDTVNNSIAHIQDVFKSKLVQKYNNDYKNAYKNNNLEQSQKRTGYVFQGPAQPNLFVENAAQNHNKGFIGIDLKGNRGLTDIDRNLILIGTTGDITTVLHESAHYFLNMLEELERVPDHSPKVDDALFAIRKTLKNDGTPFTRSQHEKFAKGFEHYIYTGNARNNLFKEIYEDIKNLLKNIYEFVQKGQYFTTGEGALTEEEMKNFNNVFDEIFKLENKTVKERVFAKVLALDEKEEEIRNKQEQELAEIWEIHNQKKEKLRQEKAASEDEKSIQDIRQDAIKYADKKENAKWKEYNEDRKNVAYSILSAAADMPAAEIKRKLHSRYKKTREDIELKLREVGDQLAASGLFEDAKVKEYFGSIDFSEVDASQQLADMARDAIENDVNLDSPLNQDINRVLNQFEYLKKKAQKAKGHQNTLILEAMFDMLSDVTNMSSMPSMFIEDLGKMVMSFAEKNEETLDRRTKRVGNKDVFRRYILKKLKDVKLYSKEDKRAVRLSTAHALYAQVATATNASTTERLLRKINNAMIEDIEMRKKSIIAKEIARQLRVNSKIVTTKTRVQRGLYDWKTNSVWQALAEINKMNRSELEANLDKLLTPAARALVNVEDGMHEQNVSDKDNKAVDFSFENKLKKKFITYKLSKNLADVDSALMLDLLSDIIEFKNVARTAKSEKEQTERLQKYELKNDLAERILNAPNAVKILIQRWFGRSRSLQNWDTFLRVCFGEDAVDKYSILDEETEKIRYEHRILAEFWSKTAAIYGKKRTWALKRWLFDPNGFADVQKLFREYESADNTWYVEETLYNRTTKEPERMWIKLNKAQIITMYAWDQNGLLHKRLINQFGEGTLNMLFGKLSEEDKKFAWLLIDTCSSLRGDINEVMTRSQGLAMVPEENYIPSIVKRQGDAIQTAGIINSRVGNPSFNHLRSRSEHIAMRPINPLAIVTSHVDKMSAYVCVSEKAAFVSEIFGAPRLATAFENAFDEQMKDFKEKEKPTKEKTIDGKKLYEMLAAQLAASTYFKYTQAVKTTDDVARKVINNYLTQAIGLKPKIGLSQILSVINYADGNDITIMAWTKNFLHCMCHPLETIKFMKRDEFLQERFKGPLQNETMKSILTEFDKWNNIKTFFTSPVRFADMFAIMFGGKAYIDHLMKNGVSEEEAFRRFRRKTNESQQSTLPSTLSNFQRTKDANAASALVLAFTNTPTQYERKFIEGVAELFREGGDKKTTLKKILLYRIVSPLLFEFVLQNLGLWLLWGWFTGDDDKGRLAGKAALSAILCGNCGAYGLVGIGRRLGVMVVVNTLYGDRWLSRAANYPLLGDAVYKIGKLLEGIVDGDIETADVIASAALALSLYNGTPAPAIVNSINGLVDISQGDFAIGLHEFLGWGRGASREAFE